MTSRGRQNFFDRSLPYSENSLCHIQWVTTFCWPSPTHRDVIYGSPLTAAIVVSEGDSYVSTVAKIVPKRFSTSFECMNLCVVNPSGMYHHDRHFQHHLYEYVCTTWLVFATRNFYRRISIHVGPFSTGALGALHGEIDKFWKFLCKKTMSGSCCLLIG